MEPRLQTRESPVTVQVNCPHAWIRISKYHRRKSQTWAGCFHKVFHHVHHVLKSLFPQTAHSPVLTGIFLRAFSLSLLCHPATHLGIFSRAPNRHHTSNRNHWRGNPLIFWHQTYRSSVQARPPLFLSQWDAYVLPTNWAQNPETSSPFLIS